MVASEQGVVESPTLALEITVWKAVETKIALVGVVEAVDLATEEMPEVVVVEDTEVATLVQDGLGLQVPAMAGITILVEEEEQMIGGETKILSMKK